MKLGTQYVENVFLGHIICARDQILDILLQLQITLIKVKGHMLPITKGVQFS